VHDNAAPWSVLVMFFLIFGGFGAALLFFADHILDWQIRLLQARWYRRFTRGAGVFFLAIAVVVVFAALFSKH
jgi:hypothetical protein